MAKITFEDKNKFAGQPFNGLKATEVNEIKESVNAIYDAMFDAEGRPLGYAVVAELPDTIPEGTQLLYNGTMWRGLLEGESSLDAGTPWPVRGYKLIVQEVTTQDGSGLSLGDTIINDFGLNIDFVRVDKGHFVSENFDFNDSLIIINGNAKGGTFGNITYNKEEGFIATWSGLPMSDLTFEFGGTISITQYPPPAT